MKQLFKLAIEFALATKELTTTETILGKFTSDNLTNGFYEANEVEIKAARKLDFDAGRLYQREHRAVKVGDDVTELKTDFETYFNKNK